MHSQDKKQFSELMGVTWATLGNGKVLNPALMGIYFDALDNYDIEDVKTAFGKANVKLKWFPKPVEIIELITGSNEENGDFQATEVLEAIKHVGHNDSVEFPDKTTQAVIQRVYGGWIKLCTELKEAEVKWFLKDFAKYYKSFKSKGVVESGYLIGLHEHNNQKLEIEHDKPVLIGEVLKQLEDKT